MSQRGGGRTRNEHVAPPVRPSFWVQTQPSSFLLVVAASALWGTDALFRRGLSLEVPATTVVFGEHVILVAFTAVWLVRGLRRAWRTFSGGDWVALLVIGAGSSATATILFTLAFSYGDPNTPLLLQKLQPLLAVSGAALLLNERFLARYWAYFVVAVAGAYLVSFPDPAHVTVTGLAPALLSAGAAALWAAGTVLGRRLTDKVSFTEMTGLRLGFGLPASAALLVSFGGYETIGALTGGDLVALLMLALIPGLLALALYYRGLRGTPAASATLAELGFPLSALVLNYLAFDAVLSSTQVVGLVLLAGTMTAMSIASHRGAEGAGIRAPSHAR